METPNEEIPVQIKLLNALMDAEIAQRRVATAEANIKRLIEAGDALENAMHEQDLLKKIEPQGKWFLAKQRAIVNI
jgi:hypothetical protein